MTSKTPNSDLERLLRQEPDRSLASLEADLWSRLAQHTHARRVFRGVYALQAAVLAAALVGSTIAGLRSAPASRQGELNVFSPRPVLAASTLLTERGATSDRGLAADHEP